MLLLLPLVGFSQVIPKATGFVTDEAGLFTSEEVQRLNQQLQALDDSTSNEIAIYTTTDLQGYDIASVALEFGRQNGVGQKKSNNGVVIVIKPKTSEGKGKAFISVGYGLEGAIPDAIAKRIVENEMIPAFKQGNHYAGVQAAVEVISKLAAGEIKAANYKKKGNASGGSLFVLIIIAVFVFIALSGNRKYAERNNLPFWAALGLFSSMGSRHHGSWNNFSGGGGSGGGFGGFGGGSFGGGGAGGDW